MRLGHTLVIQELTEHGPAKETVQFRSYYTLDAFLGRNIGYVRQCIERGLKTRNARNMKRRFILESARLPKKFYLLISDNDMPLAQTRDITAFYDRHKFNHNYEPIYAGPQQKNLTPEQLKEKKAESLQRAELLRSIEIKYGGIDHAEGTPELNKLRELLGA